MPLVVLPEGADALVIELWDAAEGAESIEVLRPDGSPASCSWQVDGGPEGGTTERLVVSGADVNARLVRLDVDVDGGAVAGPWVVRYRPGNTLVTDRTTWDVFLER